MPVLSLQVPTTAATAGTAVSVLDFRSPYSIQVAGISSGTFYTAELQIQISNDNTNWIDYGSAITLNSVNAVTTPSAFVRIYTSAYTSGTITATLAGTRVLG